MNRPMLAGKADLERLQYPMMASPKLDGVRAVVKEGKLLSRSFKPIANKHTQALLSKYHGYDGELIVGPPAAQDVYRVTQSAVNSIEGEPDVRFFVFDQWHIDAPFTARWQSIDSDLYVKRVPHIWVNSPDELDEYEARCLTKGFEGVMLRDPNGHYKQGRSTAREALLLKVKRFMDSEAYILDMVEQQHNGNAATVNELGLTSRSSHKDNKSPAGVLGALKVRDVDSGVEFEIGTGFTAGERDIFWRNRGRFKGQIVKYKYFEVGVKDRPRHPVYLGMREGRD